MADRYYTTKEFWNNIFRKGNTVNPNTPMSNTQIEASVKWVSKDSKSLLDFGCGSGRVVLKSLSYDVEQVHGIDISEEAIARACKNVNEYDLEEKATFEVGGVEKLKAIESNSYDGAILFNVIDNVFPKDAIAMIEEIHRIVRDKGKVLVKFNPYIEEKLRKEYKFEEVEEEFYKETTGLYLWNLTDKKIKHMLQQYFDIEEEIIVKFPEHNQINRMYYTRNKK